MDFGGWGGYEGSFNQLQVLRAKLRFPREEDIGENFGKVGGWAWAAWQCTSKPVRPKAHWAAATRDWDFESVKERGSWKSA